MVAREERDKMMLRESIAIAAQNKAEQIIANAKQEAEGVKGDADNYVIDVLSQLEEQLDRTLQQARNGIEVLKARRGDRKKEIPRNKGKVQLTLRLFLILTPLCYNPRALKKISRLPSRVAVGRKFPVEDRKRKSRRDV